MSRIATAIMLPLLYLALSRAEEDPHFRVEGQHYLDFPVTKKDFTQWATMGAAVILKNRTVVTPETKDKKGIIYSTVPNPLTKSWMLELEVHIGNDKQTLRGGTGLGLFYLRSIDKVSHKESIFGYSSQFEGIGIYLNSILRSDTPRSSGTKDILNAIQGFYNFGDRSINIFSEKQHICYKRFRNLPPGQFVKLRLQYDAPFVSLHVFDLNTQVFELCFSFEADINFNGYFLLSAASGVHNPDHVYLKSIKLFDPKVAANNEHFQEARHAKSVYEEVHQQLGEAIKDLFESQSLKDARLSKKKEADRSTEELVREIPVQHNHLQHQLETVITDHESTNTLFFEYIRGQPQYTQYTQLNVKLFAFRLTLDSLSAQIEKDDLNLRQFEKKIKQVKYSANIQKGLDKREVNNQATKKLQIDLQDVDLKLQQMAVALKDYHQVVETLGVKIRKEEGFTGRLESERKQFAKKQSEELVYDMSEIDKVFDQMELQVVQSGGSMSTLIVNIGMGLVICFSMFLWLKMNRHEGKNA